MRRTCSLLTLTCLVWTFLLFPSVEPVYAQSTHGREATRAFTWVSPEGLLFTFQQIGTTYQVEFIDQETGETMSLDFLPQPAPVGDRASRFAIRIDEELELLYQGAGEQEMVVPGADQMIVRFRGQERVSALMPPVLDEAMMGSDTPSLSPAASLMASGLVTLHDPPFYSKIESSMESLLAEVEATAPTAPTIGSKTALPNWFHCMVGIVGWVLSWSCVVAGCATIVACFACIGVHTLVTAAMADTCAHRSEIIKE